MESPRNYKDTNENPEKVHKAKGRVNDLNDTYIVNAKSINHFVYHLSNSFSDF